MVVVEHDEETIRSADYVVDMGPGAGIHGGFVVAKGTPEEIARNPKSLTGKYLSHKLVIPIPSTRRQSHEYITLTGCKENNLKDITVKIPIGVLSVVTGVSGSGKSTLVYEILYKGLMQQLMNPRTSPASMTLSLRLTHRQGPRHRPKPHRTHPAQQPGDLHQGLRRDPVGLRQTQEAKVRGYNPGRFSFNVPGGRCEACGGDGLIKIEMNFLPDIYVECEECKGKRYNKETLEVTYKGKSIADVLGMSVKKASSSSHTSPGSARNCRPSSTSDSNTSSLDRARRPCPGAKPSASS